MTKVDINDVVQLDPAADRQLGGCLLVVDEVRQVVEPNGMRRVACVVATVLALPVNEPNGGPRPLVVTVPPEVLRWIGKAAWAARGGAWVKADG